MGTFSQLAAISTLNIKNIRRRLGSSMVIVVGIGGVVVVLVSMLAMAEGFTSTLAGKGLDDRVIILRQGSNSEINGSISFEHASIISNKSGIAHDAKGPLAASESFVSVNRPKRGSDDIASAPLRGVSSRSFDVRPEVTIINGRNIDFGHFEVIVGKSVASQFEGLDIGNTITLRNTQWEIVGLFESDGSIFESEIWTDVFLLNSRFGRGSTYSSMAVKLEHANALPRLREALVSDRRLATKIQRESDFYSAQSATTSQMIYAVGVTISIIMAIGAMSAALNTMYSAVATRSVEIATLRALGFGQLSIVVSVIVESLLLALVGGLIGCALTFIFFNGFTASTIGNNTQVSFDFIVTFSAMSKGLTLACGLGLIGGLLPSVRAATLPITYVLRKGG